MSNTRHKFVLINPRQSFKSESEIWQCAGVNNTSLQRLHLFNTRLVAAVIAPDGAPHGLANGYLAAIAARSRSATGDTVRSYAEALVSWLNFLGQQSLQLHEATEETVALFRNCLQTDSSTQKSKSISTTRHRLAVACGFHKWTQQKSRLDSPLGKYLQRIAADGSIGGNWRGRGVRRGGGLSIAPRRETRLPRILTHEEIVRLFIVTPPLYKLIFRWCVATGMRRFEVCSLKKSQLPTPSAVDRAQGGLIGIDVLRKGSRMQSVQVPAKLIHETDWYFTAERAIPRDDAFADFIFLNTRGRPIGKASVSRTFRACANKIDSDATLHHLRHTFAVHVLSLLDSTKSQRPVNSLKALQVLLGHSNVQTTEIYLRALDVTSDTVMNALDYLYGATL